LNLDTYRWYLSYISDQWNGLHVIIISSSSDSIA
jgi:hypothetical protein